MGNQAKRSAKNDAVPTAQNPYNMLLVLFDECVHGILLEIGCQDQIRHNQHIKDGCLFHSRDFESSFGSGQGRSPKAGLGRFSGIKVSGWLMGGSRKHQFADGCCVLWNTIGKLRFSPLAAATLLRQGIARSAGARPDRQFVFADTTLTPLILSSKGCLPRCYLSMTYSAANPMRPREAPIVDLYGRATSDSAPIRMSWHPAALCCNTI